MSIEMVEKTTNADKQAPAGTGFVILDQDFKSKPVDLNDAKVTRAQIVAAAGFSPTDDVIVLQQLPDGSLKEVDTRDLIDLRGNGAEKFFAIAGDRTYRFNLDGIQLEWPRATVTGEVIRLLAQKDETFHVNWERENEPDQELDDDDTVDLSGAGIEKFTTKVGAKDVTVFYSDTSFTMPKGKYTTEQLNAKFSVPVGYVLDRIAKDGEFIELKSGDITRVKEGQHFVSHPPCGHSS